MLRAFDFVGCGLLVSQVCDAVGNKAGQCDTYKQKRD